MSPVTPRLARALLDREETPVAFEPEALRGLRVGVTGAAGSLGRAVVHAVLEQGVAEVRGFDFAEAGLFRLRPRDEDGRLRLHLEDVRDEDRMTTLLAGLDAVVHAAAYKHVPLAEAHPRAAVLNNVGGTLAALAATRRAEVPRFLLVSSDKAVAADAVMGATKRLAEGLVAGARGGPVRASTLRLANVLGSDGSVLETFRLRLLAGRELPLCGEEPERLFVTPSEAAAAALFALTRADDGETIAPDPGAPVAIRDLGERLAASLDREARFTPVPPRPGDRREERLFSPTEEAGARREGPLWRLARAEPRALDAGEIAEVLGRVRAGDDARARDELFALIAGS
ncbi:MAG: polysaccharide biosynthesis protein [Planctomycetota bacterium]